ncbi:beclin 1-associated autophagy-related key regulator [Euwallacea fornicatus]|uniref:beclin 1-associated autophagy-related key regulator n=1 Tax=Euwallacea fornicatus TaxID=995702 RepID=UPI00338F0AEB
MEITISSEDSSTAPRIFHINDHISSCSDSPNARRCPLCKKFKRAFYCKDCLHQGLIIRNNESLGNIQMALDELNANRLNMERACLKSMESKLKYDSLLCKVRQARERNKMMRLALEEQRQKRQTLTEKLNELKDKNEKGSEKMRQYKTKSGSLDDVVSQKYNDVALVHETLLEKNEEVKKLARLRVQQLFKYIFPINEVKPTMEMESSGDSVVKELAEASQTTYLKDMWVYTDYSNETQFSVVGPCLPGSGNYSNYNLWAQNRDGMTVSEDTDMTKVNPAFTISAALTHTAHLVNVISFFLNVRLPYKMVYSDFSSTTLKECQFNKRVARLNANILHLCVSQNVDLSSLSPTLTIHNILQLRDNESAELGRQGPVEFNETQAKALESLIANDLKYKDDSDSDEGDSFTVEWEAVPHMQCPEAMPGPAIVQTSVINTQQASSVAGGLMNSAVASVATIWRGFTGR